MSAPMDCPRCKIDGESMSHRQGLTWLTVACALLLTLLVFGDDVYDEPTLVEAASCRSN